MNENQIADIWMLMKEFVDAKNIEALAERYVDLLADHGIPDKVLSHATGVDNTLDEAIEFYLDEGTDSIDEIDYDSEDYDNDE